MVVFVSHTNNDNLFDMFTQFFRMVLWEIINATLCFIKTQKIFEKEAEGWEWYVKRGEKERAKGEKKEEK